MSVIVGFTILLMLLLTGYMIYRLVLRRKPVILVSLCLQIFAVSIAIVSFFDDVQALNIIQACYIAFGIILPGAFFVYDYNRMMKKVIEKGAFSGLVEAVPRNRDEEKMLEPAGEKLNSNINERQVNEILRDLKLDAEEIAKNFRKLLESAQTAVNKKDYPNALDKYKILIKLVKDCPPLLYNHGNLCSHLGNYREALLSYKKAIEIHDKYKKGNDGNSLENVKYEMLTLLYNTGNVYFKLGDYEQAIQSYKSALNINPDFEEANENMLYAMMASGKADEALEMCKKVVARENGNHKTHFILGELFEETKQFEKAEEEFKICVKLDPRFTKGFERLGKVLLKTGKKEESLECFKTLERLNPEEYSGYYYQGTINYSLGHKEKAVEYFRKAAELKPDSHRCLYNLAVALDETGNQEDAAEVFRKVTGIKDDFVDAYNNLGIILSNMGKNAEALEVYMRGIEKNPGEYSLYYNLGITLSEMRRYSDAVEAYNNALAISPEADEINYHLGAALMELHKYTEAVGVYKKALKSKPSDSDLFYNLAAVYSLLSKQDIAMDNLKKAVDLNRDFKKEARFNKAFDNLKSRKDFRELVS